MTESGGHTRSEAVYLDAVSDDGEWAMVARLCRYPQRGVQWAWLHVFAGARVYSFTDHGIACGARPVRQARHYRPGTGKGQAIARPAAGSVPSSHTLHRLHARAGDRAASRDPGATSCALRSPGSRAFGFANAQDDVGVYARRVYWRLSPLPHPIIPHHFRNTQPIAAKHTASSRRLRTTMRFQIPPRLHRRLITPKRQRQHPPLIIQTLKPLDRNKAVDLIQQRTQLSSYPKIRIAIRRLDLKDHRNHFEHNFRNVRSSRIMNRSAFANS